MAEVVIHRSVEVMAETCRSRWRGITYVGADEGSKKIVLITGSQGGTSSLGSPSGYSREAGRGGLNCGGFFSELLEVVTANAPAAAASPAAAGID